MSNKALSLLSRTSDKAGSIGSVGAAVSAMGCAACFPAIAPLGASLGLGFLSKFEGLFINTLLPVFALIALVANLVSAKSHPRIARLLLGIVGPCMVLATRTSSGPTTGARTCSMQGLSSCWRHLSRVSPYHPINPVKYRQRQAHE